MPTSARLRPILRGALALALLALAGACGGSGGAADDGLLRGGTALAQGLTLASGELPPATVGHHYGPVRLSTDAADPSALTWRLWSGALPDGLALTADGRVTGTPRSTGIAVFSVHVSDGTRAGVATRAVAVDTFGVYARRGLLHDEAWSGHPVELVAVGAAGPVTFSVVASGSGGRLAEVDAEGGRAVWVPGTVPAGAAVEDLLEAYDTAGERVQLVSITVRADPTADLTADFGSTDVWYVSTTRKHGTHPYAYDFHRALALAGLRGTGDESHDAFGTCADMLAAQCVRRELLRALGRFYLLDRDPALALPVSFPYHQPGAGFGTPAPGRAQQATPGGYNEIGLLDGGEGRFLGTALLDDADNGLLENDTTSGPVTLGVFLDAVLPYYGFYYRSTLVEQPVGPRDVEALHALLHDLPPTAGRYAEIRRQVLNLARVLATILAHEIGHSLGLPHTDPPEADSLMNASAMIRPWDRPRFLYADLTRLRARLPGPGRGFPGGAALHAPAALRDVAACPRGTCHLHGPALFSPR